MTKQSADNRRSIPQVNRLLRGIIETETLEQYFWTSGLIQRLHQSSLGHCYFNLVDGQASIHCMLHEERRGGIHFQLENNLEVEVFGDVQFYAPRASVQIMVRDIRLGGQAAFVKPAIDRLREAGLYPPRERPPPQRIRRIGCITGRSSRAIGDFETTYQSMGERAVLAPLRWQYTHLHGERAPQLIADAIRALDATADIDAVAVIRGGGRRDDFAAFESFAVAQAISQCQTYIITGIGHHHDQTLSDLVADHAAATPTAAAHFLANLCLRAPSASRQKAPRQPVAATSDARTGIPNWAKVALVILAGLFILMMALLRLAT
ncbi:MAG: exodeoxyribonuclease VII large subunit [Chloroflexi bacterium]|nr:exodeoxyribonuclease VII large subunit [Chloroflexota bacterium]MCY3582763.1 exodeoxyribonuclease VII large subunit [Chloroflexota bacterium]MCY3715478.1 exodeoxyribonuclease VII large subunit [Chloroflexota bacterium]MDE2650290.1 exodeoxyribonuclease VII large subunit [Chloroflexota bacterium]MXV92332.1 exodeoxyribonuclease VII large subunit [Chloroflexota bacterium]